MAKTPLLFLYSSKGYGGIVRNLSLILQHINLDKFEPHAVLLQGRNDSENELGIAGRPISFEKLTDHGKFDLRCLFALRNKIREHNIRVVSCHGYKADVYGFLLKHVFRLPISLMTIAHGWIPSGWKMRLYYFLDKCAMRGFDRIVLITAAQRRELGSLLIKDESISIVANAADPRLLESAVEREAARKALGVNGPETVVCCIGRLSREKRFDLAIAAGAELQRRNCPIVLLICGEGTERQALEAAASDQSVKAVFCGFRRDIEQVYAAADIYLSTSEREGMPNTLLEAQALGLPCAASDISGNNDIITHEDNGLLFLPGDSAAAADQLQRLCENVLLREQLGARAKDAALERFSLAHRVAELEKLYRGLAGVFA